MEVLQNQQWLLSVGTFLPLAGVLVMLFIPKREESLVKGTAIVTAAATMNASRQPIEATIPPDAALPAATPPTSDVSGHV